MQKCTEPLTVSILTGRVGGTHIIPGATPLVSSPCPAYECSLRVPSTPTHLPSLASARARSLYLLSPQYQTRGMHLRLGAGASLCFFSLSPLQALRACPVPRYGGEGDQGGEGSPAGRGRSSRVQSKCDQAGSPPYGARPTHPSGPSHTRAHPSTWHHPSLSFLN